MDLDKVIATRAAWRQAGARVVLTNGCFDILHAGHLRLLEEARRLGDALIVALNSDASVRALKGPGRPIIPLLEREEVLLALEPVDAVVSYEEETPARIIATLLPDILVKGADWGEGSIVGRETVEAAGGRVVRVQLLPGRSTSALVSQIRKP
jgi:rfaE bifunctional protein nucleotidyltransferase chain/domain